MNVIESLIKLNISEECFDSILEKCLNSYICESSDEKVGALFTGRQKRYEENPSLENKYKLKRTMIAIGNREGRKAKAELDDLKKEVDAERSGEAERRRKVEALKDVYKHGNSKQAEEEHDNAMINQYRRNKLEKLINCSYTDENGYIQGELFDTELTGRNLQQEKQNQVPAKKTKNPKRVAGGKQSHITKKENQQKEFNNRPIFQALNYNPEEQNKSET